MNNKIKLFVILVVFVLVGCQLFYNYSSDDIEERIIYAEVVALDQPITYNRFGSYNPYGMMYALKRDVVDTENCSQSISEHVEHCQPMSDSTKPGHVRLRVDKRPRPLTLRASSGDRLQIKFYNMLMPHQPDYSSSDTPVADTDPSMQLSYSTRGNSVNTILEEASSFFSGVEQPDEDVQAEVQKDSNWPRTRLASITISGMQTRGDNDDPLVTGLQGIKPGEHIVYEWNIRLPKQHTKRKQTYLFFSHGAPAGGEGDGGSLVHGLFGALNVEPKDSRWFRSQVNQAAFELAREQRKGNAYLNYEAVYPDEDKTPVLEMIREIGTNKYEIIYGDLNAVIHEKNVPQGTTEAFREFTVIFHDELKTFYADQFKEVGSEFTLSGVADGFAINYGASGLATMLIANRKNIGPAKDCINCAYEEFFLESWVNGDPALLADFEDDPSNVHHSYLNDRVEFRNLHAGPKETHVFHLHAHQWLSQESDTGSYLDSQTIGPQQGFTYPIYYGGSGNRNKTPGDSIFHCHLYPHFAQGMWELWRVHDVLEDGSRRLPDAQLGEGTNLVTGESNKDSGTPIPALIPLPKQAMVPEPTYQNTIDPVTNQPIGDQAFPGYPFYIAGVAGQRAPQPPYDIKEAAGLGRHIVMSGTRSVSGLTPEEAANLSADEIVAHALRTGDFSSVVKTATIKLLPEEGTQLEKVAMDFHSKGSHPTKTPEGNDELLIVNDKPPVAGAPFADPCTGATWSLSKQYVREYNVSAIQTDLIVNRAGWHDPQARINVLDSDVLAFEGNQTDKAEPFFFRANSGDCIRFNHTNRTPTELDLDDFQVKTPTDIIGQHIHLVKFDVTSSDGSGNGFNYEDGTFAKEEIDHLIEATHAEGGGAYMEHEGNPVQLSKAPENVFQTTTQRWYADPLLTTEKACIDALEAVTGDDPDELVAAREKIWGSDICYDRTIRTVFTHDHFGPSSIQQHGFYSALLVEPRHSVFLKPNGEQMAEQAVGSRAMIIHIGDDGKKEDYREFALAVADFALLYDGKPIDLGADKFKAVARDLEKREQNAIHSGEIEAAKQLAKQRSELNKVLPALDQHFRELHRKHGKPIDPPYLPEAISKTHHNPYLVNYKHEPIPLRIGCSSMDSNSDDHCSSSSVSQQKQGPAGDMVNAFDSKTHGDPVTPVFVGYEGEKVQLRLIQGAQEVQHSLNINGQVWSREINVDRSDPEAVLVSAQEIGISEHFEMPIGLDTVMRGDISTDYLYNFGSVDDLWNGAWGLIRSISSQNIDRCNSDNINDFQKRKCQSLFNSLDCDGAFTQENLSRCLVSLTKASQEISDPITPLRIDNLRQAFPNIPNSICPANAPNVSFLVAAVDVSEWLGKNVSYADNIKDPDSLSYLLLGRFTDFREAGEAIDNADQYLEELKEYYQENELEPLVLRANKGDCIQVALVNRLTTNGEPMADAAGDAMMPKIVPLNVDQPSDESDPESNQSNRGDVVPSSSVGLHPQKVFYSIDRSDGSNIGWNTKSTVRANGIIQYEWYAGTASLETCDYDDQKTCIVPRPVEFGASNLTSQADIINHPVHGLFGALIIEPENSVVECLDTNGSIVPKVKILNSELGCGTRALIRSESGLKEFKEFVVFYRDGMNLHYQKDDASFPIPDCLVCDDSYDRGEQGINFNSEQFWARLGQQPVKSSDGSYNLPDLNGLLFPEGFFTENYKKIATPKFVAHEGDEVRFRVLQPHGRARQRSFLVYGHDFDDMLPEFGSPHAPLISVGKAMTAKIESAREGTWLYRDGVNHIWAGGSWGIFQVLEKESTDED